jgi:MarR family 2-MHQ and catechol resistance regulon transcriptional repressor
MTTTTIGRGVRYGEQADRALDLWVKLSRAHASFSRRSEAHIRSFGLTPPQFSVLECLGHKGCLSFGELCKKLMVSGGNMTVVVDNLVKEGLVERIRSGTDRRRIHVALTAAGKRLIGRIFPRHAEAIAAAAEVLSPTEQEWLAALLKKLGRSIQDSASG